MDFKGLWKLRIPGVWAYITRTTWKNDRLLYEGSLLNKEGEQLGLAFWDWNGHYDKGNLKEPLPPEFALHVKSDSPWLDLMEKRRDLGYCGDSNTGRKEGWPDVTAISKQLHS